MGNKFILGILILTAGIFLVSFTITRNPEPEKIKLEPMGFSIHGFTTYYLSGGADAYLEYKEPAISIKEPTHLPKLKDYTYSELLLSFIQSLLFEYKNYKGSENLSAYSFFGLGNFRIINDELLKYANNKILNNQKTLQVIYDWMLPYYQTTFNSITVEEQQVMVRNLEIGEQYVVLVLEKKNQAAFDQWIKKNEYTIDEKTIGFLNRRIDKKQWTIADCKMWISRIKKYFLPIVKNPEMLSSHYQITEVINDNLFIAVNHKGEYVLIYKDFKIK